MTVAIVLNLHPLNACKLFHRHALEQAFGDDRHPVLALP
jgi:hypothetical protein